MATSISNSRQSLFARLFAGDVGIDPYTREISNIYQDLFGESQFVGKGIYDVKTINTVLGERFPEDRILSHDMIEGSYTRCGFLNDVEFVEEHPSRYLADISRRFRWARGDWQIARWLLPTVPGPDGKPCRNPLSLLAKWMIIDNLRRTLMPLFFLVAFLLGWFGAANVAMSWTSVLIAIFFLPNLLKTFQVLFVKPEHLRWYTHIAHAIRKESRIWLIDFLDLLQIPFNAYFYVKAILLTAWRLLVSHRHMLEWQTASDADKKVNNTLPGIFRTMWIAPLAVVVIIAMIVVTKFPAFAESSNWFRYIPHYSSGPWGLVITFALLTGWFLSPIIAWWLSRQNLPASLEINKEHELFLRKTSRRTWAFFEQFVSKENHWLPPDNFQEDFFVRQAHRT